MADWIEPRTNWTASDRYNFGDLDRVENNTRYLADVLTSYGYTVEIVTKTGRTVKTIEFADELNRIESNERAIVDAFYEPIGWEQPVTDWSAAVRGFGFRDAIRLEKNLLLIYELWGNVVKEFRYCGAFTCGAGEELY
ncbi:hypothetical protein ACFSL6_08975 [Paenibacillus thailandensis]|uniref:Uncharacterized protein n=1 Tax=Paenibacillus thailandensis TaxID=393250 RepID=A0ABW5QTP3_9BACL